MAQVVGVAKGLVGLALASGVGVVAVGHRLRNLGATPDELATRYPGDELVPDPADEVTRAVAIDAPAAEVWSWLVQIGQGRGGLYSYDWLENLFGLDIHTTDEVRDEWQRLDVGDRVVVVPPGRLGMPDGYAFPVAEVEPGHHLVLRQCPPEHPWNAVWTFVVEPDGSDRCRLISRSRNQRPNGAPAVPLRLVTAALDPVTLVMTRRMLQGIKERAERRVRKASANP